MNDGMPQQYAGASATDGEKHGQLVDLIVATWSAAEIREEARRMGLHDRLPEPGGTHRRLADEFTSLLDRRGRADVAFFDRLEAHTAGKRRAEVRDVGRAWNANGPSPEATDLPGSVRWRPRSNPVRPIVTDRVTLDEKKVARLIALISGLIFVYSIAVYVAWLIPQIDVLGWGEAADGFSGGARFGPPLHAVITGVVFHTVRPYLGSR